jgi:hypothetical protein
MELQWGKYLAVIESSLSRNMDWFLTADSMLSWLTESNLSGFYYGGGEGEGEGGIEHVYSASSKTLGSLDAKFKAVVMYVSANALGCARENAVGVVCQKRTVGGSSTDRIYELPIFYQFSALRG